MRVTQTNLNLLSPPLKPTPKNTPRALYLALHLAALALLHAANATPTNHLYILLAATWALYAAASFRDPGYVEPMDAAAPPHQASSPEAEPSATQTAPPAPTSHLSDALLTRPLCLHCDAVLLPRTKHCHDCCRCVRRMDHHCWWLGNCVGEKTHVNFVAYLAAQTTLLFAMAAAALTAPHDGAGAGAAALEVTASVVCTSLCALGGCAALMLLVFQCALVLRGETTWEKLKRKHLNASMQLPPEMRPYDRGPARNVLIFLGCVTDVAGASLPPERAPLPP